MEAKADETWESGVEGQSGHVHVGQQAQATDGRSTQQRGESAQQSRTRLWSTLASLQVVIDVQRMQRGEEKQLAAAQRLSHSPRSYPTA